MKTVVYKTGVRLPFIEGNTRYAVTAEVEAAGPYYLGKGYWAYVVNDPYGRKLVAEVRSGAIIGTDIEQAKTDVLTGDPTLMEQQVVNAIAERSMARRLSEDQFWRVMQEYVEETNG